MEKIKKLLHYAEITGEWKRSRMDAESARFLTLKQVEAFEEILTDDESWEFLLTVFNSGRDTDAWLATDWPNGFDELLLCVPLCKLVDFECHKCFVGIRQENNSCANDFSLFGYIAELLKESDRAGIINHIDSIKKILLLKEFRWNIPEKKIENF